MCKICSCSFKMDVWDGDNSEICLNTFCLLNSFLVEIKTDQYPVFLAFRWKTCFCSEVEHLVITDVVFTEKGFYLRKWPTMWNLSFGCSVSPWVSFVSRSASGRRLKRRQGPCVPESLRLGAHQEGYGELITSGKNMRAKNPPPMSGLEKTLYNSTSWIENLCKKTTDTVSSFSQDKTVKLWVKMNLNHTVIFSLRLELKSTGSRVWGQGLGWSRWPHLS